MRPKPRRANRWTARAGLATFVLVAVASGPSTGAGQPPEDGNHLPAVETSVTYSSETLEDLKRNMETKWLKGRIDVFIGQALVFGQQVNHDTYCSPWITASNSTDKEIAELFVGIDFQHGPGDPSTKPGQPVGSTFSQFRRIPVGAAEDSYFHRLESDHCSGLTGKMKVVRCAYVGGEDCTADVDAVTFGSIPLKKE